MDSAGPAADGNTRYRLATHVACGSVNETSLGGLRLLLPSLEPPPSPSSSSLRAVSKAARYSRTAWDASSAFGQAIGWLPGIRFVLSTSALIRLASTENASPPTRPAAMH